MKKELGWGLLGFLLCFLLLKSDILTDKNIQTESRDEYEVTAKPLPTKNTEHQQQALSNNKAQLPSMNTLPDIADEEDLEVQEPYFATVIELAKVSDDLDWHGHFQGNNALSASQKTQFLSDIFDLYTNEAGYFYDVGCNHNYCAVLAQNFSNEAQAQSILEKITNNHQLGSFIYTKVSKVPDGYNLRLSVPIKQDIKLEANLFEAFKQL